MSPTILLIADVLVAVLLGATIVTSIGLSRRIQRLKNDEAAMRATIGELMQASATAERAIAGLRSTLHDCDRTLADRLRTAERYAADLAEQVEAGETVVGRIMQIVEASRRVAGGPEPFAPARAPEPQRHEPAPEPIVRPPVPEDRLAAAAQALAERAARRLGGEARVS
ncbi:MAG TPA: DUF6468 domain-containing protein [Salinarimonas sp.]|jgi:hypothetical protein|nr:DUF6468 domain-containing protein [Salinarimonas sp.]